MRKEKHQFLWNGHASISTMLMLNKRILLLPAGIKTWIEAVCITSWYPKFNGSHFDLPPSSIHRMTGLGGNMAWMMMYAHRPRCVSRLTVKSLVPCCYHGLPFWWSVKKRLQVFEVFQWWHFKRVNDIEQVPCTQERTHAVQIQSTHRHKAVIN